ncbi:MAG: permease, partial [Campylobacteraceae bacterium]|nr:permease [Campylobacteraceae bacterium]
FVFLSAGPATNIVTAGVVKKMLGTRALWIYLGSIAIGSLLFGLGLDYIFDVKNINPKSIINIDDNYSLITIASSIFLWGSILYFLSKPYAKRMIQSFR